MSAHESQGGEQRVSQSWVGPAFFAAVLAAVLAFFTWFLRA